MPVFQYKALNLAGSRVRGVVESESAPLAVQALVRQGLYATEVRAAEEAGASGLRQFRLKRISQIELVLFLRQLATLVNSDVSLVQSLSLLERQVSNVAFREIIGSVREEIQGGRDFSQALALWPRVFTPLIVSMVRVGETGGVLGPILEELAGITERDHQIRSEVRAAMVYPIVVVVVGVLVVGILMAFVVPKLTEVFMDMGGALPLPTRALLAISVAVRRYWWVVAFALGGLFLALRAWRATEEGRLRYDWMALRFPVLGDLARKASICRFARALGVLLSGGVPLLESLQVVKGVLANAALGKAIEQASSGLRQGGSLARELEKEEMFPPLVIHMIGVGENSGNLDKMLIRIAETYEWQTQMAIKVMLSLLGPMMILGLAVVVGFIALSLVLPLFSMSELIR